VCTLVMGPEHPETMKSTLLTKLMDELESLDQEGSDTALAGEVQWWLGNVALMAVVAATICTFGMFLWYRRQV
jgi:hypothetical protein